MSEWLSSDNIHATFNENPSKDLKV